MTTYAAISNSEIAVGAPITNTLMTKLRDNHLAQGEGDATAPDIAWAALALGGFTEPHMDWANSDGMLQWGGNGSNEWGVTTDTTLEGDVDGTSWVAGYVQRIWIPANVNSLDGQVYGKRHDSFGWAHEARITIGGSSSTAVSNNATGFQTISLNALDVSALSGWQTVQVQHRTTQASAEGRSTLDGFCLIMI